MNRKLRGYERMGAEGGKKEYIRLEQKLYKKSLGRLGWEGRLK